MKYKEKRERERERERYKDYIHKVFNNCLFCFVCVFIKIYVYFQNDKQNIFFYYLFQVIQKRCLKFKKKMGNAFGRKKDDKKDKDKNAKDGENVVKKKISKEVVFNKVKLSFV